MNWWSKHRYLIIAQLCATHGILARKLKWGHPNLPDFISTDTYP